MAKDEKSEDAKRADPKIAKEPDPEPPHGGDWFWGGDPPEMPPEAATLTKKAG